MVDLLAMTSLKDHLQLLSSLWFLIQQ
jgi:hypothetical protein